MRIVCIDGKPVFACHLIKCDVKKNNIPFVTDDEGVLCFNPSDVATICNKLKELNIYHTVVPLDHSKEKAMIDPDTMYQSRSEIIDHLQNGKIPKHKQEQDVYKRLDVLEKQVAMLMKQLGK